MTVASEVLLPHENEWEPWLATVIPLGQPFVLLLKGELAAGKTTLVQKLVHLLGGVGSQVSSPTFTLHQQYQTAQGVLHHFDLYRLNRAEEVLQTPLPDLLDDRAALIAIEWFEKVTNFLAFPPSALVIEIGLTEPAGARKVKLRSYGEFAAAHPQ